MTSHVNKGIADYEAGRIVDGPEILVKLKEKHGIKRYKKNDTRP